MHLLSSSNLRGSILEDKLWLIVQNIGWINLTHITDERMIFILWDGLRFQYKFLCLSHTLFMHILNLRDWLKSAKIIWTQNFPWNPSHTQVFTSFFYMNLRFYNYLGRAIGCQTLDHLSLGYLATQILWWEDTIWKVYYFLTLHISSCSVAHI